eukprot:TRINITY_DN19955_c0_g1_i1.p1 TRINITY_DN19955_c0_g1~~TRINITY_DN19955_c0_g1_i1.p1  ORF type:complete len:178 (+),score=32.64 TRINITY_DN19955_c0_g1_i1:123-656(+)
MCDNIWLLKVALMDSALLVVCGQECAGRLWAQNCSLPCGHCAGDGSCDMDTGHCSHGCQTEWTGMSCDTSDGESSNSDPNVYVRVDVSSIVAMVAALALLAISLALIISVCCTRRRRDAHHAQKAADVEGDTCPSDGDKMADSAYGKVPPAKALLLLGQKEDGAYTQFDNGAFRPDA